MISIMKIKPGKIISIHKEYSSPDFLPLKLDCLINIKYAIDLDNDLSAYNYFVKMVFGGKVCSFDLLSTLSAYWNEIL